MEKIWVVAISHYIRRYRRYISNYVSFKMDKCFDFLEVKKKNNCWHYIKTKMLKSVANRNSVLVCCG